MAIARTATAVIGAWTTADPTTGTIDCTGADFLTANVYTGASSTVISADYNGTPMFQQTYIAPDAGSNDNSQFTLVAPDTGTNVLAATETGSTNMDVVAVAYSGVDQTTPISDVVTADGIQPSGTSEVTPSLTVDSSDDWVVWGSRDVDGRYTTTTGWVTFEAIKATTGINNAIWDSNGTVTAGSSTMTLNLSPAGRAGGISLMAMVAATAATRRVFNIS